MDKFCIYGHLEGYFVVKLTVQLSLNWLNWKHPYNMWEGNTLKIYAVTICDYSVKKASLDKITLVIAVCPPFPLLAYDHRVLWVRELHIWTLQHGNWLSQSALFWHN